MDLHDPLDDRVYVYSKTMDNTDEKFVNVADFEKAEYKDGFTNEDIVIDQVDFDNGNLITSLSAVDFKNKQEMFGGSSLNIKDLSVNQMPVIDLDIECELLPSSRPGHYHLFIHKEMSHVQYMYLLNALRQCGIIEDGFYYSFLNRGFSAVRTLKTYKKGVPVEGERLLKENGRLLHENAVLKKRIRELEDASNLISV